MSATDDNTKAREEFDLELQKLKDAATTKDELAYYTITGAVYKALVDAYDRLRKEGVDPEDFLVETAPALGYAVFQAMAPGYEEGTWPHWLPDALEEAKQSALDAARNAQKVRMIQ
ncbi:hypothetical protein HW532_15860 [Kaustia mangrovi]|uniref:Uncharacterized protein n=1 Tax=Kaustia mangrovi TaxID=2593653 RepID=A0A7S8HCS5_9HYPH|nr:hypothetical protein [Kaustia mangrovi]QPC44037.1 hypothetical protein HW532_15860 [Kaustia mangrovi]